MEASSEAHDTGRKKLRVGHRSERTGISVVRGFLERHNLVVDEVDGRADYGRDLNVDLTDDSEITGGIIGVQVKSGPSYWRHGRWLIPAAPTDWTYWRSSTVPVIGMVYDPAADVIRWRNLTQLARGSVMDSDETYFPDAQSDETCEIPVREILDDSTYESFIHQTTGYLRATSDSAFLALVDSDPEVQRRGVFNCWTIGRRDPRPLVLLRRVLPGLSGAALAEGISVLAHATAHPDILWTRRNWIPPLVEKAVRTAFQWSPEEVAVLVMKLEPMNEHEGELWRRGGLGQSLWSLLVADRNLQGKLPAAIRICAEAGEVGPALRLLIFHQYLSDDPVATVEDTLATFPMLAASGFAGDLLEGVHAYGRLDVY